MHIEDHDITIMSTKTTESNTLHCIVKITESKASHCIVILKESKASH